MKTSKKLLVLILALAMVFACAVPAFADPQTPVKYATYTQVPIANAPTVTGEFTVTLNIVSHMISSSVIKRTNLPVTLGSTGVTDVYTVSDVFAAAAAQYSWLYIYRNANFDSFTSTSQFVYGVKDTAQGSTVFAPDFTNLTRYRGWMFKINGQYPLLNDVDIPNDYDVDAEGPCGAKPHQAYVVDGDVIDLFFCDNLTNESVSTRTMQIMGATYSNQTLTIDVYSSYSWQEIIIPDIQYFWHVNDDPNYKYDYWPIASLSSVYLSIDNSSSYVSISNGVITKNNVTLSPGVHKIEIGTLYTGWMDLGGTYYKFPKYLGTTYYLTVQ